MRFRRAGGRVGAMKNSIRLVVPVAGWTTQGQYALVEACVDAGFEVPAHVGHREDAVLYVLEGEVELVADRSSHTLGAGEARVLDRGVPRRLRATTRARVLVLLV